MTSFDVTHQQNHKSNCVEVFSCMKFPECLIDPLKKHITNKALSACNASRLQVKSGFHCALPACRTTPAMSAPSLSPVALCFKNVNTGPLSAVCLRAATLWCIRLRVCLVFAVLRHKFSVLPQEIIVDYRCFAKIFQIV